MGYPKEKIMRALAPKVYRQGISLSNLANWVTEFFEVVPISMMSEGHFKRLAHSEKTMVVT